MSYKSSDLETDDRSHRLMCFEALQRIEREHAVRVVHAMIKPSGKQTKQPTLYVELLADRDQQPQEDVIKKALMDHAGAGKPFSPALSFREIDLPKLARSYADHPIALRAPLVTSPFSTAHRIAALWGNSLPDEVRSGIGTTLLHRARMSSMSDTYIQSWTGSELSESTIALVRSRLQSKAVSLFNGVTAVSSAHWGRWAVPKDIDGALNMLGAAGLVISSKDRQTLTRVLSDNLETGFDSLTTDEKHALVPTYMKLVRNMNKLIVDMFSIKTYRTHISNEYLLESDTAWLEQVYDQPKLDSFESNSIDQASLDLLSGASHSYREVISTTDLRRHEETAKESSAEDLMFSF